MGYLEGKCSVLYLLHTESASSLVHSETVKFADRWFALDNIMHAYVPFLLDDSSSVYVLVHVTANREECKIF